ncbi:helix-turn-helix transcriptional regulator [Amycolatopsis sp. QT-25]|uniref:helix-turn-helix domain-containing protein n=1 Tax=Amycolatopsis sp. QT-25 TaxID=3034022 RepID=UPI0023EDB562|nr:helix-turn-helix transcriptional regulator [Amycolatopsis sp. QT-25]WET82497.1 helix-turn-helix transcriptional regulator [Amycolatopsis sp. QT-25]
MGSELGGFLRSRRARIQPADVGLSPQGRRRVPGLRRDEVAVAAGVSTDYYTRVEQGRATPSWQVLDAVAAVLRLDDVEREHLLRLTGPRSWPRRGEQHAAEGVQAGMREILVRLVDLPAVVLGGTLDLLAWTPLAAELLGLRPGGERNMARRLFLQPESRLLYPEWNTVAAETVSHLRRISVERPSDAELVHLVRELSVTSAEFARLWRKHDVAAGTSRRKVFHHPQAGCFELEPEVLASARDRQTLCIYRAEPGTVGADALVSLKTLGLAGSDDRLREGVLASSGATARAVGLSELGAHEVRFGPEASIGESSSSSTPWAGCS